MPGRSFSATRTSPALEPQERVRRGLARTFQINTLFPGLNALEAVTLAVGERRGIAGQFWQNIAVLQARRSRKRTTSWCSCGSATAAIRRRANCPTAGSGCWRSRWRWRPSRKCCCSTSRPPACRRRKAATFSRRSPSLSGDLTLLFIEHDMHVVFRFATPHHRDGRRRASSPKARRPRSPPIRACAKSIWGRANMAEPLLTLHSVTRRLRRRGGAARRLAGTAGARQPRRARPQRRRQVDAAAHHHGLHAIARRPRRLARPGYLARCRRIAAPRGGIGWVAQEREIFPSLTVEENLTVAARPGRLDACDASSSCSRAWPSAAATWATSCPAASSRCWRSRAR